MHTFHTESNLRWAAENNSVLHKDSELAIRLEINYLTCYDFFVLHFNPVINLLTVRLHSHYVLKIQAKSDFDLTFISEILVKTANTTKSQKNVSAAFFVNLFMDTISPILI